jgi:hypothetical protein
MDYINWESLIFAAVIILLLLPYWAGPVLIRLTMRQAAEPDLQTFEPNDPILPREVAGHFRRVTEALKPTGFEVVQGMALPNQTPRVQALVLLLVHRANKDAALATAIYAQTPEGTKLQTAYVEIVSRFQDESAVQTNNTEQLGAFPKRPKFTTTRLPMIRKADRLYRLHQALEKRHGSKERKILRVEDEFRGDAVAYLSRAMVEELEAQIETGYMYLSQNEGLYRPTWKGAFLMTWALLWPFSAMRRWLRDREAQRLLRELEA